MTRWKKIGIGVGTLLAIIIAIVAIALYATHSLTDVIRFQLSALKAGDYTKAYSYTSKNFQAVTSLTDFEEFVKSYPALKDNAGISITSRKRDSSSGTVKGNLQEPNGSTTPVEYHLVKEDKEWKILSITVNPSADEENNEVALNNNSGPGDLTKIYDNKDSHYMIKYPSNWEYDASSRGTVIFSGKRGTPSYFSTVNIQTVLAKKTGGDFSTVKQFITDLKKQASGLSTKVKFLEEGPIEFNETSGKKATGQYLVFTYTYKGMIFKQWQVVILRNDGQVFYAWAYTSPSDQYDQDVSIAKAMLNSWTIY